jgi:Na+/H+ antiporter NhaD/arsenite permease-like protein
MTIVELVDAHEGFRLITDRIHTRSKKKLLWLIALVTFFLSAALDNLTTSIVMVSLLRKIIDEKEERMFYAGIVIITANAGGAWSPIGDVTTTMLWVGGQITAYNIVVSLFLPSLISVIVPLIVITFQLKGDFGTQEVQEPLEDKRSSMIMLIAGLFALLFVPFFKTITHLEPYMGMLFGLAVVWVVSERINSDKDEEERVQYSAAQALSRVDSASILFFLGILLAVGSLEATNILQNLALWIQNTVGNEDIIVMGIGISSAIVDNVPLVAAAKGMYSLENYPPDSRIWEFLAYCAGTGGSILIIGSAAGVAVMGMEKIGFFWYVKRISLAAIIGYFAGAFAYILFTAF